MKKIVKILSILLCIILLTFWTIVLIDCLKYERKYKQSNKIRYQIEILENHRLCREEEYINKIVELKQQLKQLHNN
jgi:sortase (surface protein transpeptidase)